MVLPGEQQTHRASVSVGHDEDGVRLGGAERPAGGIPYRLWIGVTGHRDLSDVERLTPVLDDVVVRIRALAPSSRHTPLRLGVVSPLAEGADRLVAAAVLRDSEAALEVALPLPAEEYVRDFVDEASRQEFSSLMNDASLVTVLPAGGSREAAYAQVGHYVVDRSDVLVAVWDGLPARGTGGTAEIVAHARDRGVPLFLVSPDGGQVVEELGTYVSRREFDEIDGFNATQVSPDAFTKDVEKMTDGLLARGSEANLDERVLKPFLSWAVPHLVRMDLLARRYQRQYLRIGNLLFGTTFLAVTAATVQSIFASAEWITAAEVMLMFVLLVTVLYGRRRRVHSRWLSYRRLAERFRTALFQGVAALGLSRKVGWDRLDTEPARLWVRRLFEEAWISRPSGSEAQVQAAPEAFRQFLLSAWLDDQLTYHQHTARRNERRDRLFSWTVIGLICLTLGAALVRISPLPGEQAQGVLLLLATTAPALAAALSGMRAQRQYLQNAEKSRQMADHIAIVRRRLEVATDLASVQGLAQTMGLLMLDENQDWYSMMQPHDFEVQI